MTLQLIQTCMIVLGALAIVCFIAARVIERPRKATKQEMDAYRKAASNPNAKGAAK